MAVNVRGVLSYSQACFPLLEAKGGCMIHIGSDAWELGEADIGDYSGSNAAVYMLG